jgi:peptide/nickel transport system permease protein
MIAYMIRRIMAFAVVIIIITAVIYFLFNILPGDAAVLSGNPKSLSDPKVIENLKEKWGLNEPIYVRYFKYLYNLFRGDLGTSYRVNQPVATLLGERVIPTLQLALVALIISTVGGITLGFFAAINRGSLIDVLATVGAVAGVSTPEFWLGLLLIFIVSVELGLLPTSGYGTWRHLVLPAFTLGLVYTAFLARISRSSVLDVLPKDHVNTARAKGLSDWKINMKHILRNAFIPMLTVIGLQFGSLIARVVVVETVFGWPGVGRLMIRSIHARDIITAQGCVLFIAFTFIFINLIVDISYGFIDPRIRYD